MQVTTLKARLRERERQRFFVTFLGGKMVGIVLAAAVVLGPGKFILGTTVHALAPGADVPIQDQINSVVSGTNTAWTLLAAFLVFFMQAGFMMLEAGFARTREVVNVLQECIVDTCLCGCRRYEAVSGCGTSPARRWCTRWVE